MGCGCGGGSNVAITYNGSNEEAVRVYRPPTVDCNFDTTILLKYQSMLQCCKDTGKLSLIELTTKECNSYLGYLQSALNYPDNYCYYYEQVNNFSTNIVPRIINNVINCTK